MTSLRTIPQLVADFRAEKLTGEQIRDWLAAAKLKPRAEVPYGRGQARFYDKDEAYEVIRKKVAERKVKAEQAASSTQPAAGSEKHAATHNDVTYLIGVIEEQRETIDKILAGQQMLFKHVEGIAHQVNALVSEWRGEAAKATTGANGVDIDAVHRRPS